MHLFYVLLSHVSYRVWFSGVANYYLVKAHSEMVARHVFALHRPMMNVERCIFTLRYEYPFISMHFLYSFLPRLPRRPFKLECIT